MRSIVLSVTAFLLAAPILAVDSAPSHATLSAAERADLLAVRESAWWAWFRGDNEALGALLPAEFLAFGAGAGNFEGREAALASSRGFAAGGGKLVSIEFPRTEIQVYGDVAILYSSYVALFESDGKPQRLAGRATEVFVRRDGKWLHPGWHLDTLEVEPAPEKEKGAAG